MSLPPPSAQPESTQAREVGVRAVDIFSEISLPHEEVARKKFILPEGKENWVNGKHIDPATDHSITIIVGGTNLRIAVNDINTQTLAYWQTGWKGVEDRFKADYKELHGVLPGEKVKMPAAEFLNAVTDRVLAHYAELELDPNNLKKVLFVVAGPVSEGGIVTLPNTPVDFISYPLLDVMKDKIKSGLNLDQDLPFECINDGFAGAVGEIYHPIGELNPDSFNESDWVFNEDLGMYQTTVAYMIIGTGVGGCAVHILRPKWESIEGQVIIQDPVVTEFGHCLVATVEENETRFEWNSLDELKEQGFYNETGFKQLPVEEEKFYAEHVLAGPWLACKFAQAIKGARLEAQFVKYANNDILDDDKMIKIQDLNDLAGLNENNIVGWAIQANADAIRSVLTTIFSLNKSLAELTTQAGRDFRKELGLMDPAISKLLLWYRQEIVLSLGKAIVAFHERFPFIRRIALGSSISNQIGQSGNKDMKDKIDFIVRKKTPVSHQNLFHISVEPIPAKPVKKGEEKDPADDTKIGIDSVEKESYDSRLLAKNDLPCTEEQALEFIYDCYRRAKLAITKM